MKRILLVAAIGFLANQGSAQIKNIPRPPRSGCTAQLSGFILKGVDTTTSRGVAINELMWDNGKVITVRFMSGGSQLMRNKVMQAAKEWEQFANIKFNFLPDNTPATNIRVKLADKAHNSYPGKYCNEIPQDEQTLNLDTTGFVNYRYYMQELNARIARGDTVIKVWEPNKWVRSILAKSNIVWDFRELRGTALHEFGHALGLMHEQSFPGAIQWNRSDSVYNYYLDNNKTWTRETVDRNVFEVSDYFYTNGTSYDPKSIMHYAIEPWQTTNRYTVPWNYDLSDGDKKLIAALYPKTKKVSDLLLPEVVIKNITKLDVIKNYQGKKGVSIFPTLDLTSNPKLAGVYFVARLIFEDSSKTYYVTTKNEQFHWGGFLATNVKKLLLPNSKASYNKTKKDLELFLPDNQIPAWVRDYKIKFEFFVSMLNPRTKQLEKIGYYLSPNFISLTK